jgi:hypothetical protein
MIIAHQPGSEPLTIPEQIPNPAFQPAPLRPKQTPLPQEPVKVPEKAPAGHVPLLHGNSQLVMAPNDGLKA